MKNSDMPAMPAKVMVDRGMGYMSQEVQTNGLTKREMFAMNFASSMSSAPVEMQRIYIQAFNCNDVTKAVAKCAIDYADALLAELEKENA